MTIPANKASRALLDRSKTAAATLAVLLSLGFTAARATTYRLTSADDTVVGENQTVMTVYEDTLYDLAAAYSLGSEELIRVNPRLDPWLPGAGKQIMIPGRHILPPDRARASWSTFPSIGSTTIPSPSAASRSEVITYPVSIGKMDWRTPLGVTHVIGKQKDPTWYPPESVRKEHAADGDPLPPMVAAGSGQSAGRLMRCVWRRATAPI